VDAEPIRARLDAWKAPSRIHTAQFKRIESWRERLLAGREGALAELLGEYPLADEHQLGRLIREARHERDTNHPPKSYRALFQALRTLIEDKRES
jgi:ribosome-associated protein